MRAMMALPGFSSDVLMMAEGGEGGVGGGNAAPVPSEPDPAGGEKGDEGLPAGGSLIQGGGEGEPPAGGAKNPSEPDGEPSAGGEKNPQEPGELTDEEWLGQISFTEEVGKDEKGEPIAPNVEALKPFAPVLREIGLTAEQASKLVTAYAKIEMAQGQSAREAAEQAEAEAQKALLAKRDELKAEAMKAISEEDLAYANRAMASLGKDDPAFYKMVQTSLLGVHPCFLKLCAMAGRRAADDSIPHPGGIGGRAQRTPAEILFGDAIKQGLARP